jgi:hypothetical protein
LRKKAAELDPREPLPERVYRLATAFLVSFQAMSMRLTKLGALKPEDQRCSQR